MKTKLSFSAIDTLAKCGMRYKFRYVDGIRKPPAVSMVVGSAVDEVANEGFRRKLEGAPALAPEEVDDLAAKSLRDDWAKGIEIAVDEQRSPKAVLGAAVDQSIRLSRGVATKIVPQINPAEIQRSWTIDVDDSIELRGIIDVREKVTGRVVDLKSKPGGKAPAAGIEHQSTQLSAYALATVVLDGAEAPVPVALAYIREAKTGGTEARILPSVRDRPDLDSFLARIEAAARVVETGSFMPTDPSNWWCSAKWCGFWELCIYARRPVAVGFTEEGEP